jgi:hypothetical protein
MILKREMPSISCEALKYSNNMMGQPPAKRKAAEQSNRQNKRNITIKTYS